MSEEPLFSPVVIPDLGEAGSVWRNSKVEDFNRQIQLLGLENDPQVAALRQQIESYTAELEDLWERQKDSDSETKWWHDGEYDANRADEWNDQGMVAYKGRSYGDAFECFTEAIRLHPSSTVYHSNRSLVALKLGRYDIALDDAKHSIERDDTYLNGYIRAGKACLGLCLPEDAKGYFSKAQELQPDASVASRGLDDAAQLMEEMKIEDDENQKLADRCERKMLPSEGDVDVVGISEALLGAEDVLSRHPRMESAMYHKAECLILLGRFSQALDYIETLRDGMERRYLEVEALWRSGSVEVAEAKLGSFMSGNLQKCVKLGRVVRSHRHCLDTIQKSMDDGCDSEVVTLCTEALDVLPVTLACGLYCRLLRLRASGYCRMRRWRDAIGDLDLNLSLNPEDIEAMRCKADVLKEQGLYTEYFLCLQSLKRTAPGFPGIAGLLREAAKLSLDDRDDGGILKERAASGPQSAFDILGLSRGASVSEVRQAYLKLAATWHPDKWTQKSDMEIKTAEEKFKAIQKSYEELNGNR
jgi:DnaJ homolog subfamily C member 7